MIIAIDFDGTIVEHDFPRIGQLKINAKKIINKLYKEGHIIIIWTCRYVKKHLKEMKRFLHDEEILFHHINENYKGLHAIDPMPKIYYDILIDDRSLFFIDDWNKIYKKIKDILLKL